MNRDHAYSFRGGLQDTCDMILELYMLKGSAIECITVDTESASIVPTMPIVLLFIVDEDALLDSFLMNDGIRNI